MGKEQHIDNDIDYKERENNVNDNDRGVKSYVRRQVIADISEQKLERIQKFLFSSSCCDDCKLTINLSLKQIDRFAYEWYNELDDATRKVIVGMKLEYDGDGRSRTYKEYTESPIWKYTSSVIKCTRGYKCERCGKKSSPAHLVVHHKVYDYLGSELKYPEDVELLCVDCHLEEHGIRRNK